MSDETENIRFKDVLDLGNPYLSIAKHTEKMELGEHSIRPIIYEYILWTWLQRQDKDTR